MAAALGTKGMARSAGSRPVTEVGRRRFDRERFVADCVAAHRSDGMQAVHEVLERAVADHAAVLNALGAPREAGLDVMHASPDFTIFAAHWTPQMNLLAHDHMMAALIGIYTGREDNILWRRGEAGLEAFGARCLFEGDVAALPADAIHSVTNPLQRFTGGIHIYDGDFFAVFAKVHPTKNFPHVSLIVITLISIPFCFFTLGQLVSWLIQVQILLRFIWQCAAVILIRRYRQDIPQPFTMWLYPFPALLSLTLWLYIFFSGPREGIIFSFAFLAAAVVAYFVFARGSASRLASSR